MTTKPMVACCGLTCTLCGAYVATQNDDDEERKKVAEKWSGVLETEIGLEQVNCDGCLSGGRLFFYCRSCDIRKCCTEKNIENCAYCVDYPCKKLDNVFQAVPQARMTLDQIRNQIKTAT